MIVTADDPGMASSQNEQETALCRAAGSDYAERRIRRRRRFTIRAFGWEEYHLPVLCG